VVASAPSSGGPPGACPARRPRPISRSSPGRFAPFGGAFSWTAPRRGCCLASAKPAFRGNGRRGPGPRSSAFSVSLVVFVGFVVDLGLGDRDREAVLVADLFADVARRQDVLDVD